MPIDGVQVPRSPGWWLKRQFDLLNDPARRRRLNRLHNYHSGNAPLPEGAENAREAYEAFQRKARTNFAELVVSAMSERMVPTGFRTAADDDETGDKEVGILWKRAGMRVRAANVHDWALALSEAYVIAGPVDPRTGAPRITAEDPRDMVGERDPEDPRELLAALKVLRDTAAGEDRAYLFLPGTETRSGRSQVWVAKREFGTAERAAVAQPRHQREFLTYFDPRGWDWDPQRTGELPHNLMPVVRFDNKDDCGEYEHHTDLLDRINHQILQRLVISVLQAFRQKAIKGLPLKDAKTGKDIDYTGVFTSDPAALWQLPKDAELWESQALDLTPILSAIKDDIQQLAAVTRTPLHLLTPAGVNQSAEGASLQREGLVFKTADRIERFTEQWVRVMAVALRHAGMPERADLEKLETLWAPVERLSLAERADAASKASNDIPRRSRLIHVWGFSPTEADRMETEWAYQDMVAAQLAAAAAGQIQPMQVRPGLQDQQQGGQQSPQQGQQPQQQGGQQAGQRPGGQTPPNTGETR